MKSRIWRLAGVGLLCVSVTAQSLADEPQMRGPDDGQRGPDHQGRGQGHDGNNQPRRQNNEIIRGDNSRQFELHDQNQGGERQNRPSHDPNVQGRPPQQPSNKLPIQGRPDTVRQTQEPRRGYYQDEPRRNNDNRNWQTGGQGSRHDDRRWPGRPDGRGNGWGPGPQYRPGYVIDRFPERNYRVPYRGQDYFYSGGYWYRPQGPPVMWWFNRLAGFVSATCPITPVKCGSAGHCCSWRPARITPTRRARRSTSWSNPPCSRNR